MLVCPHCQERLEGRHNEYGLYYACARCAGRAVGLGVLRRTMLKPAVNRMWQAAGDAARPTSARCPACRKAMLYAPVEGGAERVEVDVCRRCHLVWFDVGEHERLPAPPPAPAETLSPHARTAAALLRVEMLARRADDESEFSGEMPDEWWKWIPALFGLPVEQQAPGMTRLPVLTWFLAAALILCGVLAATSADDLAQEFGFIPAYPLRWGGLTLLTYIFIHGGAWHLASNLYFLLTFGDDVEERLGRPRFALLLLASAVLGALAHALLEPRADIPLVGVSGGVSGLLVYYSLQFPRARIAFLIRHYYFGRWLTMPAWFAFILWMLLQFAGMWLQVAGFGQVSAAAHLGGVAAGIWLWLAWRNT